jgi:hypothetical protein
MLGDPELFVEQTDIRVSTPTTVNWSVKSAPPATNTANILTAAAALSTDPYSKCTSQAQPGNGNGQQPPKEGDGKGSKKGQDGNSNPASTSDNFINPGTLHGNLFPSAGTKYRLQDVALRVQSGQQNTQQGQGDSSDATAANNKPKTNKNSNGGSDSGNPQPNATTTGAEVGSGTYVFGAPQVVVSVGIAGVFMQNRQYQKVQASGQSSGTTIEYSTDSSARMSPLIMAHGRIYRFAGDDAIWGTLGVTAASNNSGVSAEYFVGGTVSFLHNWIFLTPGLYVGQKEALTGGYKVGQQLPSSFSGSLPIQQSYKPAFGLAISFRVPGTSAPKNKTSNQNSSPGKNGSQTGGTGSNKSGSK